MNFAGVNSDDPAGDIFHKHIGEFANKCWNAAITTTGERFKAERAKYKEQAASLHAEVSALKKQLKAQAAEHSATLQKASETAKEFARLAKERESLASALRTAESDKRVAERAVKLLEQGRKDDRQEIRKLQKRLKAQAADIAILRSRKQGR